MQALHVTYPFLPTELRQHLPQLLTHRAVEGRVVPPGAQHVHLDGVHVRLAELAGLRICGAWKRVVRVHDVRNTFSIRCVSKISSFLAFVTIWSLEIDPLFCKTRRRMARERRGAESSVVSTEILYYTTIYQRCILSRREE